MTAALSCRGLTVRVAGRTLVEHLDLDVQPGETVCVLGVNGAGKTTTLETLCGLRPIDAGEVLLGGSDIRGLERRELARRIGLMTQTFEDAFADRALALAAMGRHPHKRFWEWHDEADFAVARRALADVGLAGFAERVSDTLSGGERQRLALAMLLVQAPRVMLLDEPLSQLDPYHQIEIGRLLSGLRDAGHGIVMSVHDINLAARLGDRVLLLFGDGRWQLGPREAVLREKALSDLYGTAIGRVESGGRYVYFSV